MNKRAISADVFSWIPKLLLLSAALLVLMGLVHLYVVTRIDTTDAETFVFINRVTFSPHGISFYDEDIGKSYPGIIDFDKFNGEVLKKSIDLPTNRIIAARLSLNELDGKNLKDAYFNKEWYYNWLPKKHLSGPGAVTSTQKTSYVLLRSYEPKIECIDISSLSIDGCTSLKAISGDGMDLKKASKDAGVSIDFGFLTPAIDTERIAFSLGSDLQLRIANLGANPIDIQMPSSQSYKDHDLEATPISTKETKHFFIPKCSYIEVKLDAEQTDKAKNCYLPAGLFEEVFNPTILEFNILTLNT